jgi:hypothetical protein
MMPSFFILANSLDNDVRWTPNFSASAFFVMFSLICFDF